MALEGESFIFLTFNAEMSGTFQFANVILNDLKDDYPDYEMAVVDSKRGCFRNWFNRIAVSKFLKSGPTISRMFILFKYLN